MAATRQRKFLLKAKLFILHFIKFCDDINFAIASLVQVYPSLYTCGRDTIETD